MAERIYVGGSNFSVSQQDNSLQNIRFDGLEPKRRLHPRLIVRKFRQVTGGMAISPIVEFHNFILEDAVEDVEEKFNIVQTFGPDFVFLLGPKPRIFSYSGTLYNSFDRPWKNDWQRAWDRRPNQIVQAPPPLSNDIRSAPDAQRGILSGTNVVLAGGIARLEYDGSVGTLDSNNLMQPVFGFSDEAGRAAAVNVREGYLVKLSIRLSGNRPNAASFSFAMIVTNSMHY
jgi:hypothetical protein